MKLQSWRGLDPMPNTQLFTHTGHQHSPAEEGALCSPVGAAEQVGSAETPAAAIMDKVSYPEVTLQ